MSIENERKITILHNSIGSNKQIVVKNGWVVIIDCSSLLLAPATAGCYGLSGNLVGISINLCKSIQKELFINDTP